MENKREDRRNHNIVVYAQNYNGSLLYHRPSYTGVTLHNEITHHLI